MKRFLSIFAILAILFVFPQSALAAQATFGWTASPSADVAGYRLYWKDKASYALTKLGSDIAGKATVTATVTIPEVEGIKQYAVVAKAYDLAGNESAESNEATKDGVAFVWKDTTAPAPPGVLQVLQQIADSLERIANALDK